MIQALGVCCGDSELAYQLMTDDTKQSSTLSDQQVGGSCQIILIVVLISLNTPYILYILGILLTNAEPWLNS